MTKPNEGRMADKTRETGPLVVKAPRITRNSNPAQRSDPNIIEFGEEWAEPVSRAKPQPQAAQANQTARPAKTTALERRKLAMVSLSTKARELEIAAADDTEVTNSSAELGTPRGPCETKASARATAAIRLTSVMLPGSTNRCL